MHPPEAHAPAPRSFREFLRAYAMIVLSILTALALEDAANHWSNREAARASRARIEQELASNAAELRHAIAINKKSLAANLRVIDSLVAGMKAQSLDEPKLTAQLNAVFDQGGRLELPTWRRAAWDAAIADRSATYLAPADLRRYAEIYANGQDMGEAERIAVSGQLYGQVADLRINLALGRPDPRQAALLLQGIVLVAQELVGIEQSMLAAIGNTAPVR